MRKSFWLRFTALMLVMVVLLCGCQTNVPVITDPTDTTPPDTTQAEPADQNWVLDGSWTVTADTLTAPDSENATAIHSTFGLDSSWEISTSVTMGDAQSARLLLCKSDGEIQTAASVSVTGRKVYLTIDNYSSGRWKNICTSEAVVMDLTAPAQLVFRHFDGAENVWVYLIQDGQELVSLKTHEITARTLKMLTRAGVGADGAAAFSDFAVAVPEKVESPVDVILRTMEPGDEGFYLALAEAAVDDMLTNFWDGDTETGRILPTSHGYATGTDYACLWESSMLAFEIYDMWALTGDEYYRELLVAEANYIQANYDAEKLEIAGGDQNWACDDCGWCAMLYLSLYTATGDTWFVDRVIGLLDSVNARWYDEELGGLHYKDGVDYMALCEVAITWSWLRLWEITGEQRFYDLSMESYTRLHERMGREDGLYFMEANAHWTIGEENYIGEGASSSFLGGNMCMAALSAKFYRLTGEQEYLDRVYKTNEGLLKYYDNDGVLLNDRDAWCNATFAGFYASEVLTLPDTEVMQDLLKNTAVSIVSKARTEDGYYGGSWSGPAEGSGSVWYNAGSVPQQCMTTGNTILMVTAAAILEAGIEHYVR